MPQNPGVGLQPLPQLVVRYAPVPGKVVAGVGTLESETMLKLVVAVPLALSVTVIVFEPLSVPVVAGQL